MALVAQASRLQRGWQNRFSIAETTGRVACAIGSCHGLNSPHSPRMVTSMSSGIRHSCTIRSMSMQLPTPLDYRQ
jgi:hypothetical protein